jgi:hypothetical protein
MHNKAALVRLMLPGHQNFEIHLDPALGFKRIDHIRILSTELKLYQPFTAILQLGCSGLMGVE